MDDSADRSLSDHVDALLAPIHQDEISRREWLTLWLVALVFTTGVTAILLLIGWWQ